MPPAAATAIKRARKTRTRRQLTPRKPSSRKRQSKSSASMSSPPSLSLKLFFSPPSSTPNPQISDSPLPSSGTFKIEDKAAKEYKRKPKKALPPANNKHRQKNATEEDDLEDIFVPRKSSTSAASIPRTPWHYKKKSGRRKEKNGKSTKLEKPQRCYKCRKMGLPENSLACSKCELVWHAECLDLPLTFRPASWTCPLHAANPKLQTHSQAFKLLSGTSLEKPVVNQSGGFGGLLNLLKEKSKQNIKVPGPVGIKVPDLVLLHYHNSLSTSKK